MAIQHSKFLDVANGTQANQFTVGSRHDLNSLDDLEPKYKYLIDSPFHANFGVLGNDGLINLTPMWFDYEGDKVMMNLAEHRKKTEWVRNNPRVSMLIVNPKQMYHWISLRCHVVEEIHEDSPEHGAMVTAHVDKIWDKYTGAGGSYALRDPSMNERRVLFICAIDRIATFGEPLPDDPI